MPKLSMLSSPEAMPLHAQPWNKPLRQAIRLGIIALCFFGAVLPVAASDPLPGEHALAPHCKTRAHAQTDYVVCRFENAKNIRFFLNNGNGEPFRHFNWVNEALESQGEKLSFAMNAGMYHEDRAPVGLFIENGKELAGVNDNDGPGNFHLKPNGVFWIWAEDGHVGAHVATTRQYLTDAAKDVVKFATQSGPMLVIDGEIHSRFLADSQSRKRRNGVGVSKNGEVIFVLADSPVNFYDFAGFFRDQLEVPNALFLDGSISRLYAPALGRNDPGQAMGPIIGIVTAKK